MATSRELRNERQRMKNALLKQIREEWTAKQAVNNTQRQLGGEGFAPKLVDISSCS